MRKQTNISLTEQEENQFYFLKLMNNGENNCYANSCIQMLLTCGSKLFHIVNNFKNCKSKFCQIFKSYIYSFENKSDIVNTSLKLRVCANINNKDTPDSYIDNSQQDSFGFMLDLISISCEEIQNNFRVNDKSTNQCTQCKHHLNLANKSQSSYYISLTRNLSDEINFNDLFLPSIHEITCEKCGCETQLKTNCYDVIGNYLILRIATGDGSLRFNTKLKNANLDNPITFPNVVGIFECKSAIIHYSNSLSTKKEFGHFTCFSKIESNLSGQNVFKWLEISDQVSEPKLSLPTDLENVYLLMFEKKV